MILLRFDSVRKHYGPEAVLAGVTFELRPGERVGLIGPNGAGKTTLMRIAVGTEQADGGAVERHPSARLEYLEQHPSFPPQRTVWEVAQGGLHELLQLQRQAEEIARRMGAAEDDGQQQRLAAQFERLHHELHQRDGYQIEHRIRRVLDGLGFAAATHEQPVGTLSGGQQNRLLLARILLSAPDLMLLDEPSNHLDLECTQWLESFLSGSTSAMLIASHDRYLLDRVTTRTLELAAGTIETYSGNFSAYWRQKAQRLEVQRRTYEKQQAEIASLEDFIRRNHYGLKAAQAEDRRKKLDRLREELVPPPREIATPPMGFPPASRSGDVVCRVERLAKGYDRPLFAEVQFDVLRGQRWGLLGPNGSGKTTLLRCLVGQEGPDAGQAVLGHGVKVGYFDQLLRSVEDDLPACEAVRPPGAAMTQQQRRDILARFGVTGDTALQPVRSLSGGERTRTALARLAAMEANLLVLDEPTNHLDLWARDALERALLAFDGTLIFVSHDRYFLNRVADHLLVLEPGGVRVVVGNYDRYLRLVQQVPEEETRSGPARATADSAAAPRAARPRSKRRFPYRKSADIEADIHRHEQQIAALEASLALPEVYREPGKVRQVQAELARLREALEALFAHWEEAVELNQ